MKKLICGVAAWIVLTLLAACPNPVESGGEIAPAGGTLPVVEQPQLVIEPFDITLRINNPNNPAESRVRTVAGFNGTQIKPGLSTFNYSQVIVLDNAANTVAEFIVHRDGGSGEVELDLDIDDWEKSYTFLVLMGHWNRTNYGAGTPDYSTSAPPTLLAAGTVTTKPKPDLDISMGQVIVDTVFVKGAGTQDVNLTGNRVTTLSPGNWSVKWTLNPTISSKTAAGYLNLVAAEGGNVASSSITDISPALIKGKFNNSTSLDETITATPAAQWYLTKDLSTYTVIGNLGKVGYVNFNLNYVPFSSKSWTKSTVATRVATIDSAGKSNDGLPQWIIRNGINDLQQNSSTNFAASSWSGTGNGNGAVAFTVDAGIDTGLAALVSGRWLGSGTTAGTQKIEFTLKPAIGSGVEVYYAQGATTPTWESGAYIAHPLGTYNAGTHTADNLPLIGNQNVWLVVVKDGVRSAPVILDKSINVIPVYPD